MVPGEVAEMNPHVVAFARAARADYSTAPTPADAPELPSGQAITNAACALRELFLAWGLDARRAGTPDWNPLGEFISPGTRVVLKPNWVLHENEAPHGFDCLCTHTSLISAVLEYVAIARPGSVVVGDAPIQKCSFDALRRTAGVDALVERFQSRGLRIDIRDFRRTVLTGDDAAAARQENGRDLDSYVLFDLERESLLEPIAKAHGQFRVTMYDPRLMRRAHAPGRHRYLIARELIDADVVLNLPKLKCHRKAGITGALKNLVGINGNKEFLPHHRKGGGSRGGDCYEGGSLWKKWAEDLSDFANYTGGGRAHAVLHRSSEIALSVARRLEGADDNLEGAWYGNDTVWRMCLDLQRVLHYGRADASMCPERQRQVISITDAIIGGEGEGPLKPEPVSSGFLTGGTNTAAVEWVNALLMGFDPMRVPLTEHSFDRFSYPIAEFRPADIQVQTAAGRRGIDEIAELATCRFRPSRGWAGHCELEPKDDLAGQPSCVA